MGCLSGVAKARNKPSGFFLKTINVLLSIMPPRATQATQQHVCLVKLIFKNDESHNNINDICHKNTANHSGPANYFYNDPSQCNYIVFVLSVKDSNTLFLLVFNLYMRLDFSLKLTEVIQLTFYIDE